MQTPSIGRIVHYTFTDKHGALATRPAIVVRAWGDTPAAAVQLQVFTDGANDFNEGEPGRSGLMWKTSISPSQSGGPEQDRYHWATVPAKPA